VSYRERIQGRDAVTVCCEFVEHVRGGVAADPRERQLLQSALEGGRLDQDVADASSRRRRGVA
jgi:exonuclease SbcD